MNKLVLRFLKDNSGATAIEYGLIAAGIAVAIIVAVQATGTAVKGTFNSVANALQQSARLPVCVNERRRPGWRPRSFVLRAGDSNTLKCISLPSVS